MSDYEREIPTHLFHMTDGRWHDDCEWCVRRRVFGGDGTAMPLTAGRLWRERKAAGLTEADTALYGGYRP